MKSVVPLSLAFLLAIAPAATACPGCRDALASSANPNATPWDGEQDHASAAYSYSVIFMLGMPFALLAGFGGAFWWMSRPAPAPRPAAEPVLPPPAVEPGLS